MKAALLAALAAPLLELAPPPARAAWFARRLAALAAAARAAPPAGGGAAGEARALCGKAAAYRRAGARRACRGTDAGGSVGAGWGGVLDRPGALPQKVQNELADTASF